MKRRHINTPRSHRAGFTLLEILVAVAAVAIIATGLAAIFDSVGKTVSTGRRVSRVNQYGRLLEQQFRRDFTRMTRDGFLVIRQQFADGNGDSQYQPGTPSTLNNPRAAGDVGLDDIALYEDQPQINGDRPADEWRPRRVDEVLFFTRGEAKSSRVAIGQRWEQPSSNESMIYYGHGMRMMPDADNVDQNARPYKNPKVNETNSIARNTTNPTAKHLLGYRQTPTQPDQEENPNVYASQWILLRKQTVLIPPSVTKNNPPAAFEFPYIAPPNDPDVHLRDYDCQVAGQPAAPSVFRSLNRLYIPDLAPTEAPATFSELDNHLWYVPTESGNYVENTGGPLLSSGIVDIATTSLAEIKSMVMGYAHTNPDRSTPPAFARIPGDFIQNSTRRNNGIYNPSGVFIPSTLELGFPFAGSLPYGGPSPFDTDWDTPALRPVFSRWEGLDYMHAWMDNAFPTRASVHGDIGNNQTEGDAVSPEFEYEDVDRGVRVRCEEIVPELLDKLRPSPSGSPTLARNDFYRQADLIALAASNLVVGCSELAIDWTFGATDAATGDVVWYGPQTPCGFYKYQNPNGCASDFNSATYVTDDTANPNANPVNRKGGRSAYPFTERLIYGYSPEAYRSSGRVPLSVSSFFGYIDPTYTMDIDRDGTIEPGEISSEPKVWIDSNGNNIVDQGEVENNPSPASRRWIWPTMIRVRVTIADPVDPSVENTFEYVFDVQDDLLR